MKRFFTVIFSAGVLLQSALIAAPVQWTKSYDQGMQQAKSQSKPLVLFFTGSDWCVWCKKLDSEVFQTPEFSSEAGASFVFVELDYPMTPKQDGATKAQNESLKNKFNIKGFPTVVILDHNGNEIARTGYQPGGGKKYADHLKKLSTK